VTDDLLVLRYATVGAGEAPGRPVVQAALERQLRRLVARGYSGARFSDAVTTTTRGQVLVVTFDTGSRVLLDVALPVLERLGLPATVFVARADPDPTVMSAQDLRRLHQSGWEIGARARPGVRLTEPGDDVVEELRSSRRSVEAEVGAPCRAFAYADGVTDTRVMAAVADAGFEAGAGIARRGLQVPLTLNWPRVTISRADDDRRVQIKTSPSLRRLRAFPLGSRSTESRFGPAQAIAAGSAPATDARVTVVIPCHNDGRLVVEAVESVVEPEPVEIIIVDDASTDPETRRVLGELSSRGTPVIRHESNLGLPAARMTGVAATGAPYVFPLDSDDLVVPGALSALADLLDQHPDVAVAFGDYLEFGTHDGVRRVPPWLDPYRVAYRNDYPVSSLFRRRSLLEAGGWRQVGNEVGYEDWHLWMTLAERGQRGLHWGRGVVLRRRLHGQRMLSDATRRHLALYATLRTLHPELFAGLRAARKQTTLSPVARWLYPLLFGWRPPLSLWSRARRLLPAARA
jgi:glycosyltransferase involved in cell wall biosynthesis/peptidoglycan/xylan/chitin deacetylase (PgdA/CDA1 family)